jgi:hypothetical protein
MITWTKVKEGDGSIVKHKNYVILSYYSRFCCAMYTRAARTLFFRLINTQNGAPRSSHTRVPAHAEE